jgi:hypothetical protein
MTVSTEGGGGDIGGDANYNVLKNAESFPFPVRGPELSELSAYSNILRLTLTKMWKN